MKKQLTTILSIILVLSLSGCSSSNSAKKSTIETPKSTTSASEPATKPQQNSDSDLPDDFKVITQTELASLSNTEELVDATTDALLNMGVTGLSGNARFGNYRDDSVEDIVIYYLEVFTTTDTGKHLITSLCYTKAASTSGNWFVNSIEDADTQKCYYINDNSKEYVDLYDYKTGNLISSNNKSWKEKDDIDFKQKIDKTKQPIKKSDEILEKFNNSVKELDYYLRELEKQYNTQ